MIRAPPPITMSVASAFTSGLTPSRTLEKITIGSVLEPGPATNCEMTRSSHDSVNASSHPDSIAGTISGSVMRKNTVAGRAPRSMRRLLERLIETGQARLYHHGDVGHAKGDVRERDRECAAALAASR